MSTKEDVIPTENLIQYLQSNTTRRLFRFSKLHNTDVRLKVAYFLLEMTKLMKYGAGPSVPCNNNIKKKT